MTDAELARIIELSQQAWANGEPVGEDGLPVDPGLSVILEIGSIARTDPVYQTVAYRVGTDAQGEVLASAPTWIRQLIAEIYALRGILGDVMRDGGIDQGKREERKRVVDILSRHKSDALEQATKHWKAHEWEDDRKWVKVASELGNAIASIANLLPMVDDPLPPEQSMREILRLRKAIRTALATIRPSMPHVVETELILREALGEDDE